MERTEPRGADELYKYYEVYETIGSGNGSVNVYRLVKTPVFVPEDDVN